MKTLKGLFSYFLSNSRLSIQRNMQYRVNFIIGLFLSIVFTGVNPAVQLLIFRQTNCLPGWTFNQIVLFQGIVLFWNGLKEMLLGDSKWIMIQLVRKGDFDRMLLKPYPPMGVLLASGFSLSEIGAVATGGIIIVIVINMMNLTISITQIALFAASILVGLIFYMAICVIYSCLAIILVKTDRLGDLLESIITLGDYPLSIYPLLIRTVFLIIIPFAVFAFIPAQILLNRADIKLFISFACVIVFFFVSLKIWDFCLKRYTSAGG